jgi:hypothetical protein
MRNWIFASLGVLAVVIAAGCHADSSPPGIPALGTSARHATGSSPPPYCVSHGSGTVTVCIHLPGRSANPYYMTVTDTLQGDPSAVVASAYIYSYEGCYSSSGNLCVVKFNAPNAVNQIQINAIFIGSSANQSVAFPVDVSPSATPANVAFSGSVSSISIDPFFSAHGALGTRSTLPLGQSEHVWVVPENSSEQILLGKLYPPILISSSSQYLLHSLKVLNQSGDAENLIASWDPAFNGVFNGGKAAAALRVRAGSIKAQAPIEPAAGTNVYTPGPTTGNVAPGPVAITPDGKNVYFAINDASGCQQPSACSGMLGLFNRTSHTFSFVPIASVPGIDQLYLTSDAVWMTSFQPAGTWNHPLPILRMPLGALTTPSPLPAAFGEGSGFAQDTSGNLWISGCEGNDCKASRNGKFVLVETATSGSPSKPKKTIDLPSSCTKFGNHGYTVGDVAFYHSSLYVLAVNDGSRSPARGALWRVDPSNFSATCPAVPNTFNPSAYFATTTTALVFGAGGSIFNSPNDIEHGFYSLLPNGKLKNPAPDLDVKITANHVAANNGVVYSVRHDDFGRRQGLFGLGAFEPSDASWGVFPSATYTAGNVQADDGVAAVGNDVWFTSAGTCPGTSSSNSWLGVCLEHLTYVLRGKTPIGGAAPGLDLGTGNPPVVHVGQLSGYAEIGPMNVHSGPFEAQSQSGNPAVCTVETPAPASGLHFTFFVKGVKPGSCPLTITDQSGLSLPLVTQITDSTSH